MANLIPIEDPSDPRIEHYRAVRDRDLAGRGGRFIAEGEVVLRHLLRPGSRFGCESLLLSANRVATLAPILDGLPPDLPVHVARQGVMDTIVGFPIHRGALAIGLRGTADPAARLTDGLPERALVLGLVGLANHDNVGGAFRNAAAFGADAVLLDRTSCDPLYRKAIRVSVGSALTVPFAWTETAEDMVRVLAAAGFQTFALSPSGTIPIEACAWPARTALLVGAEGPGLPATLLRSLSGLRITMAGGFDSLNVATAAGIALHAVRSRTGSHPLD